MTGFSRGSRRGFLGLVSTEIAAFRFFLVFLAVVIFFDLGFVDLGFVDLGFVDLDFVELVDLDLLFFGFALDSVDFSGIICHLALGWTRTLKSS